MAKRYAGIRGRPDVLLPLLNDGQFVRALYSEYDPLVVVATDEKGNKVLTYSDGTPLDFIPNVIVVTRENKSVAVNL